MCHLSRGILTLPISVHLSEGISRTENTLLETISISCNYNTSTQKLLIFILGHYIILLSVAFLCYCILYIQHYHILYPH